MKKWVLSIGFFLLFWAGYSQVNSRVNAFNLIIEKLDKGEDYEALDLMHLYLLDYPYDAIMIYNRGITKLRLNDMDGAREDLLKSRQLGYQAEAIDFFTDLKYFSYQYAKSYDPSIKLDSTNNYRPYITFKDIIRGMLRPERKCFDVYFYDLTVKVFPKQKRIEGQNKIYFKVVENTRRIQIDLFDNFTIKSIQWNSGELPYKRVEQAIFIDFPDTLREHSQQVINITYYGVPVQSANPPWTGGFVWKKSKIWKPWIGVACEHAGASLWWPNKDHLSDEPDSMRINVQVPSKLTGISNGNLRSVTLLQDGYKNYEWFVSYPINNYCVTLYAGNFVNFNETYQHDSSSYQIDYYVLPQNLEKARLYYSQTKKILPVFESLYGEYPFKRDGVAMVESPFAGMEHQSAIAIGDDYGKKERRNYINKDFDYMVVHETAHEWWGNAVSVADMADAWINEGFATYSEALLMEKLFGNSAYIQAMSEISSNIYNFWPVVGKRDINDNTFIGGDIYHKGAAILNNLRCQINDDPLFFSILKGFYQTYKYREVSTQDFLDFVKMKTGKNYDDFFEKFLYDAKPPVLEYRFTIADSVLSLTYSWKEVQKGFEMPFCIILNNKTCIRLSATSKPQTYRADSVLSFYIPNGYHLNPEKILPNSFTYFWTSRVPSLPAVAYYSNKKIKERGLICSSMKEGKWLYYTENEKLLYSAWYIDGYLDGELITYNRNEDPELKINFRQDTLHGEYGKYIDGQFIKEGVYSKGLMKGIWKHIFDNGKVESEGNYTNNAENGLWKFYNLAGTLVCKGQFINGIPDRATFEYFDSAGGRKEKIDTLNVVNSMPKYRLGENEMLGYISGNPEIRTLQKNGVAAKITLSFIVNPDGTRSHYRIEKSGNEELSATLISVLKKMPRWIPGYFNGNPVCVRFYLTYKL